MKVIIIYGSLILAGGLLFVNVYNSMVDARSWGANIPQSIETARSYFSAANPGDFFRVFSPINQILALLAVILYWKAPGQVRLFLAAALICHVAADAFTFAYFYPRNAIMFETGSLTDIDALKAAQSQWSSMNWLRSLLVLAGVISTALGLHRIYSA